MIVELDVLEEFLTRKIFPDLEEGRPLWDKPHTVAVVEKLKKILENNPDLHVDKEVLIIAAYAHDWGYSKMSIDDKKLSYDDVIKLKEDHGTMGATKLETLLKDPFFDKYTDPQKDRAIYLVRYHDSVDTVEDVENMDIDLRLLMEADVLGALDISVVTPTFDCDSNLQYMYGVHDKSINRFITEYSKEEAGRLLKIRKDYYIDNRGCTYPKDQD